MEIWQDCLTLLKTFSSLLGGMFPLKMLKIKCLRLAESAPVASFNTDKRKDQQGEEEKGVINEGNMLIIDLFNHGSLISVN